MIERDWFEVDLSEARNGRKIMSVYFDKSFLRDGCIATFCLIRKPGRTLGVGVATMNPKDKNDPYTGKKLALSRAIRAWVEAYGATAFAEDEKQSAYHYIWQRILATGYFDKPKPAAPAARPAPVEINAPVEVSA